MRTFEVMTFDRRGIVRAAIALASLLVISMPALSDAVAFKSSREALKQGISAYSGGYYEMAVPALKFAAEKDEPVANYYLARIYSDNNGSLTDHKRAYALFRRVADENADVDPVDDPISPYVGKSLTALAGYMLRGLPEIGLKPNPEVAADYLNNASLTFNDDDAQFELAKLQLTGEGVRKDVPLAKHWLATLSRKGHAGAQAFLADLLWRGLYMEANQGQALALISVAAANAPPQDRLWIEDIHQNIYCGAAEGIRKQASGIVAGWGNRYTVTRKPQTFDRSGLALLTVQPERLCNNGEPVHIFEVPNGGVAVDPARSDRNFMRGGAVHDVGATGK